MNYKSYQELSNDVFSNIHKIQGHNYDLVVGIPRSGMIPAYMIALLLNISCVDLNSFLNNAKVATGSTRKVAKPLTNAWDAKKVLLIDDSLKTGASMKEALEKIRRTVTHDITSLAVYVEKLNLKHIDIYIEVLPGPRVYQWNLFHHSILHQSVMTLEGILCSKPTIEELREEKEYKKYLSDAPPLVLPTYKINTIFTNRPEKYRVDTIQWLKKNKIDFERLEMRGEKALREKENATCYTTEKAYYYKTSAESLFIEKSGDDARRIADLSGKPVLCLEKGKLFLPRALAVIKYGKKHLVIRLLKKMQRFFFLAMPNSSINIMRKVYRVFFQLATIQMGFLIEYGFITRGNFPPVI